MDNIYKGSLIKPGDSDWMNKIDDNYKLLASCDKEARKGNTLVGRMFDVGVADGKAFYQVVEVKGIKVKLQHCKGFGDDYQDHHFRNGGWFSKKDVERYIKRRETIAKIFGG